MSKDEKVKHTPGPWQLIFDAEADVRPFKIFGPENQYIARLSDEADAHLIAAAPMQHELLACFLIFYPDVRVAAIRKWAQKYGVHLPANTDGAAELAMFQDAAIEAAISKATGQAEKVSA